MEKRLGHLRGSTFASTFASDAPKSSAHEMVDETRSFTVIIFNILAILSRGFEVAISSLSRPQLLACLKACVGKCKPTLIFSGLILLEMSIWLYD